MSEIKRCLKQIEDVRAVASGMESAYVARSRLGRLILSVTRTICKIAGLDPPDKPGPISVCTTENGSLVALMEICNALNEIAKTITQPSEPLDVRWKAGWSTLLSYLNDMEQRLMLLEEKFID